VQVGGKSIQFDPDGFMIDPDGISDMCEKHWGIVNFIRSYWQEHDLAPPVRLICKEVGVSVREIYKLFTSGPARGACRVAGLPKPDGCV